MTIQVHSDYDFGYKDSSDETEAAPVRWMAPETLQEGVFSSKSNVVSSVIN